MTQTRYKYPLANPPTPLTNFPPHQTSSVINVNSSYSNINAMTGTPNTKSIQFGVVLKVPNMAHKLLPPKAKF